ncbi:hypothetical protein [Methylobacterium sp. WL120]|uniref:hypothetical protein n=1 Tax=Methylobacterium sp. WL120 TaxID=2603887 RepID=UPI0011C814AA|nr:hypothetical protein [Methylobacterium sp. WL120]TXM68556.1 hypothetical protein FV229_07385 [Methylobacterium sp. WL120]TXN09775.1 hypothetical protein FV219_06975 [Methylobacterium sp. WL122]
MRTHIATIPSYYRSRPADIVEHVAIEDLLREFDARVTAAGMEPDDEVAVMSRRGLANLAHCLLVSTWGSVLRLDAATTALAKALDACGIDAGDMLGVPQDRVLH